MFFFIIKNINTNTHEPSGISLITRYQYKYSLHEKINNDNELESNFEKPNNDYQSFSLFPKTILLYSMFVSALSCGAIGFLLPPVLLFGYLPYKIVLYLYNRNETKAIKKNNPNEISECKDVSNSN